MFRSEKGRAACGRLRRILSAGRPHPVGRAALASAAATATRAAAKEVGAAASEARAAASRLVAVYRELTAIGTPPRQIWATAPAFGRGMFNTEFAVCLEIDYGKDTQRERLCSRPNYKSRFDLYWADCSLTGSPGRTKDFKLIHRALVVKKVQAGVRHAELGNIRLAARPLEGEHGDPDIEK